jgi:hypothetical protein
MHRRDMSSQEGRPRHTAIVVGSPKPGLSTARGDGSRPDRSGAILVRYPPTRRPPVGRPSSSGEVGTRWPRRAARGWRSSCRMWLRASAHFSTTHPVGRVAAVSVTVASPRCSVRRHVARGSHHSAAGDLPTVGSPAAASLPRCGASPSAMVVGIVGTRSDQRFATAPCARGDIDLTHRAHRRRRDSTIRPDWSLPGTRTGRWGGVGDIALTPP